MRPSKHVLRSISKIIGKTNLTTSAPDLNAYAYDGTSSWRAVPDTVVFPSTTEQVAEIMRLAYQHEIPVTVRGAGTNLSGGSIPIAGGIVLCTTRMNKIIDIDTANFTATAETGVVLHDLNVELAKRNLFFPPDPQSFLAATLGGCVSENAGGPYALKYGVFKHYLLGIQAVLPPGEIVSLGGKTMKNVTGYDLPLLICGSEGTLAVVTQVTLRLLPAPQARQTILASFDQVVTAGKAVHRVISSGVLPAKIEIMDNWIIRRIEETTPLGLPVNAEAILLFEVDGNPIAVEDEASQIIRLCNISNATEVRKASNQQEADGFWAARRAGFSAIFGNAPTVLAEDVTVPIDKLPTLMIRVQALSRTYDIPIVLIGHAGDGNLHPCILTNQKDPQHFKKANLIAGEIFTAALELGGVISGEHGIGLEKKGFIRQALGSSLIELHEKIKSAFDPKGLLNPNKIWNQNHDHPKQTY